MHLFVECVYTRQVWTLVAAWVGRQNLSPSQWATRLRMVDWWIDTFHSGIGSCRKGQASLILLTLWHIWKERNRRIFQHHREEPIRLLGIIKEEAWAWAVSGATKLRAYLPRNIVTEPLEEA